MFDAESEYLDSDAVFGVRDGLSVSFDGGRGEFDFVLEREVARSLDQTG